MTDRYRHTDLIDCTTTLFQRAGLDENIAQTVSEILVEAELLGYGPHGLQFVPAYIAGIESGRTATTGEPAILKDTPGALLLDARRLPGQWVVVRALDLALKRLADNGVICVAIRGSENISCLATYIKRAAARGVMAVLTTSSPGNAAVAPFGGRAPRYSTNSIAIGIPTDGTPILIDTSTSSTTNRMIERTRRSGGRLAREWLVDNTGQPSDDPEVFYADPPGAIMPAGAPDQGHKGFAFAILVEALTSGLAGVGRADGPAAVGSNLFLQLIDPRAFGGLEAFQRETGFFAEHCRNTQPLDPDAPVRMPGDRAVALYDEQCVSGVALHPEVLPRMKPFFEKYDVPLPTPIAS
jgi:L-lactate dehydrogenase